jgi:hypothetical protein
MPYPKLTIVAMTRVLEAAVAEAEKLAPEEQDALGALLMEEMASEKSWSELLAKKPSLLETLAAEAVEEHRTGRTKPLEDTL